jgi:hypothetical protein
MKDDTKGKANMKESVITITVRVPFEDEGDLFKEWLTLYVNSTLCNDSGWWKQWAAYFSDAHMNATVVQLTDWFESKAQGQFRELNQQYALPQRMVGLGGF